MALSKKPKMKDRDTGSPLVLSQFLPYRLSVVSERVSWTFANRYQDQFGLSIPEWRVMAILGEHAPRSTQDVIDQTEMDRVRVSRAVIRLSDKGLLLRKSDPKDQRAQLLSLSPQGRKIYRQIVPMARRLQNELAASLQPTEWKTLDAILAKLYKTARELQKNYAITVKGQSG